MFFYTNHLHLVDFLLIVLVVFFFAIILVVALMLRHKTTFAFIIIFLGFLCSGAMAYLGYFIIDNHLRSRITQVDYYKYFVYDNSLSIEYSLTNTSKNDFNYCKISVDVFKNTENDNAFFDLIKNIKPLRSKSEIIKKTIKPKQTINFKTKFSDFKHEKDFNIKLNSKCF